MRRYVVYVRAVPPQDGTGGISSDLSQLWSAASNARGTGATDVEHVAYEEIKRQMYSGFLPRRTAEVPSNSLFVGVSKQFGRFWLQPRYCVQHHSD